MNACKVTNDPGNTWLMVERKEGIFIYLFMLGSKQKHNAVAWTKQSLGEFHVT